jgi:hypothetical protein
MFNFGGSGKLDGLSSFWLGKEGVPALASALDRLRKAIPTSKRTVNYSVRLKREMR